MALQIMRESFTDNRIQLLFVFNGKGGSFQM